MNATDDGTPGSEAWWRIRAREGGPSVSAPIDGECKVTFWWRDPYGDECTSAIRKVWINIAGVTDHHQPAMPQTLRRCPGTDVWSWQTRLPANWRGSYCFIPSTGENDFPPETAVREGWRRLLPQAIADPLNPLSWRGGRGHPVSALSLPEAPGQPGWDAQHTPYTSPVCIEWQSVRLGNVRRVWIFATGQGVPQDRPLAILLDGQFWAESMPPWPALQALTDAGKLPEAVYLLVDAIDTEHRGRELPCNADFWLAVWEELLPLAYAVQPFSDDAEKTLVAGQSFGGLAALYAGLNWPQRVGCVLSQSGSFWWPRRKEGGQGGWLVEQIERGKLRPEGLRIFLFAGQREPLIFTANQRLYTLLRERGMSPFWRPFDGGHDALCWRGGLTEGLIALWSQRP